MNRLRAEFLEMPGLQLTFGQVQRLCGVEKELCRMGLDSPDARTTDGGGVPSSMARTVSAPRHVS